MKPIWETWHQQLHRRPSATDDFSLGAFRRPLPEALQKRYLEVNPFGRVSWFFFDIDHEDAFECWEAVQLPAPNVFVQNRHNGRAHLGYALHTPVGTTGMSREKPMKFAADVQHGMTVRLMSDRAFANRFTKNPMHHDWRVSWLAMYPYELNELRGWLDDEDVWRPRGPTHALGLGRNCDLFDTLRFHAYRQVREYKRQGAAIEEWLRHLQGVAITSNLEFATPLSIAETRGIAKSVARWTWLRFDNDRFRERQAERGRRGAEKRWEGHMSLDYLKPWDQLGISRPTYFRRKKAQMLGK